MGEEGLGALVEKARALTGRPSSSRACPASGAAGRPRRQTFMIGARSMQNTPLLRAAGRSGLPVVLKRGMAATYDEWLAAAEYVLAEDNPR